MKRKIITLLIAIITVINGMFLCSIDTRAEEIGEDIDYSYLLTSDALVGYTVSQTRGIYLMDGNSVISRLSSVKIGAGGTTNAAERCTVSITSIVERETSDGWVWVTSWTQTNEEAFSAAISKSLFVGQGSYYRVRSLHYAASDASSSCTDALYMPRI